MSGGMEDSARKEKEKDLKRAMIVKKLIVKSLDDHKWLIAEFIYNDIKESL